MAGPLNYLGLPEGVFFRLTDVEKGNIVEVIAENGDVYRYDGAVGQADRRGGRGRRQVGRRDQEAEPDADHLRRRGGRIRAGYNSTVLRAVLERE
jgi:hypothetical protein